MKDASQGEIESHLKRGGFSSATNRSAITGVNDKTEDLAPDGRAMIGLEEELKRAQAGVDLNSF